MRTYQFKKPLFTVLITIIIVATLGVGSFAAAAGLTMRQADVTTVAYREKTEDSLNSSVTTSETAGFDVTKVGATGSDSSDDTQAIQNALDKYDSVYIPDGTYYINVDRMLHLNSGQTLTLSEGATLQAMPTASGYYRIITISNVTDVAVSGGRIVGDRTVHTGSSGEWGMGIAVENGSKDVAISNIAISNCWGDGVFLGDGATVSNVTLDNVVCDNNRRQGLSITNAVHVTITDCTFKNTNGTAPEAGIDIEPDAGYTTSDITIKNTQCIGNAGSGIDLMGLAEYVRDINITESVISDNSGMGLRIYKASEVQVTDTVTSNNFAGIEIPGDASNITFTGVTVTDNHWRGVSFVTSYQSDGCSNIVFESSNFSNNSKSYVNNEDGIRIDLWDASGYIKDVTFSNCQFYDDQSSKTQRYGLTVGFTNNGMSGIVVESSCVFSGNIAGNYLGGNALTVA